MTYLINSVRFLIIDSDSIDSFALRISFEKMGGAFGSNLVVIGTTFDGLLPELEEDDGILLKIDIGGA